MSEGVFRLEGPLTVRSAQGWLQRGRAAIAAGASALDFSAVTEADSAALALVVEWQRAAGRSLTLIGLPAGVASLAELYGIESLLRTA